MAGFPVGTRVRVRQPNSFRHRQWGVVDAVAEGPISQKLLEQNGGRLHWVLFGDGGRTPFLPGDLEDDGGGMT